MLPNPQNNQDREVIIIPEKPRSERIKIGLRQWAQVLPFLFIGLAGASIFVIYPLIKGIVMSFQDYNIMPGAESPFVEIGRASCRERV